MPDALKLNLFGQPIASKKRTGGGGGKRSSGKAPAVLGCEGCPQNGVPGINKLKGLVKITGRQAMIWGPHPGKAENRLLKPFAGNAGEYLWEELGRHGMKPSMFDLQTVVRCWPADQYQQEHKVTRQEIKACSVYNQEAIQRNNGNARVHLVMGKVAGASLFGNKYRKDRAVFWHDPWNSYVVLTEHPAEILRQGKRSWAHHTFRDRLKAVRICHEYGKKDGGRYSYIRHQNYAPVSTEAEMDDLEATIMAEVEAGRRVSFDIEDGVVAGKRVLLLAGFGWGVYDKGRGMGEWKGGARSIVLHHPENKQKPQVIAKLIARLKAICENPKIKKVMQHGGYDKDELKKLTGIRIKGYDYDTQYAMYLKHPHLRTYSMQALINSFFQEFQDYKQMFQPEGQKKGEFAAINFADLPLDKLILYNCADCDVTKRAEMKSNWHVNHALLQVYIHVAPVLDAMQKRGPILDRAAHKKLSDVVDARIADLLKKIRAVAGDPEFNPDATASIATLLYDTLRLPQITDEKKRGQKKEGPKSGTGKDILQTLIAKTHHPVLQNIIDYRAMKKIKGTYLDGYARSADANGGELRTIWFLTGAVTGRLRSGKGEESQAAGIINFQNLHGNPLLKNLLVSDANWRLAL